MSDQTPPPPTTTRLRIPAPTFAPGVVSGTYANNIQELSTDNETFLDFRYVAPASYGYDDTGAPIDIEVANTVVAQLILPKSVFFTFVEAVVRNNPALAAAVGAQSEGSVHVDH